MGDSEVLDLFCDRIVMRSLHSKKAEDIELYVKELDAAWALALVDPTCMVVASDMAVPCDSTGQSVACALIFQMGEEVRWIQSAAGLRAPPETERFALQLGISAAIAMGCQQLIVFSDSAPAVEPCSTLGFGQGRYSPSMHASPFTPGLLGMMGAESF